jgi:hypothetical protein
MGNLKKYIFGRSKTSSFFLDQFQNKALVFSLRKLSTYDNNYCVRIRRSFDNLEENFGFVNGVLDTTNMLNFVGSGDAFVRVWFDQSGFNRHAIQTDTTKQPKIVESGSLILEGGKPTIKFTSATNLRFLPSQSQQTAQPLSNFGFSTYQVLRFANFGYQGTTGFGSKLQNPFNGGSAAYMSVRGETNRFGYVANQDIRVGRVYAPAEGTGLNFKLFSFHIDETYDLASVNNLAYVNNSPKILTSSDNGYGSVYTNVLNQSYNGVGSNVNISETILFDGIFKQNNAAISTNINLFYNLY